MSLFEGHSYNSTKYPPDPEEEAELLSGRKLSAFVYAMDGVIERNFPILVVLDNLKLYFL